MTTNSRYKITLQSSGDKWHSVSRAVLTCLAMSSSMSLGPVIFTDILNNLSRVCRCYKELAVVERLFFFLTSIRWGNGLACFKLFHDYLLYEVADTMYALKRQTMVKYFYDGMYYLNIRCCRPKESDADV